MNQIIKKENIMKNCNLTFFGVFLRLFIGFCFIYFGYIYDNYILYFIGIIPLFRMSYYFLFVRQLKF
jgi:hypothetical protein